MRDWIKRNHWVFPIFLLLSVPFVALFESQISGGLVFVTSWRYYIVVGSVEAFLFFLGYQYGMWVRKKDGR